MSMKTSEIKFDCVGITPAKTECDLLAVPVFEEDDIGADMEALNRATGGQLGRSRLSGEFRAKVNELFVTRLEDPEWRASRVILVGVGSAGEGLFERFRNASAAVVREARRRRVGRLGLVVRKTRSSRVGQAIAEGALLGNFDYGVFKTEPEEVLPGIEQCSVIVPKTLLGEFEATVNDGYVIGTAVNHARELANSPGNVLTPTVFAERADALLSGSRIAIEILDEGVIEKHGMGLLLGVARGSAETARLIVMRHEPDEAPKSPVLGLVGKGITFDSGGISLKPADGMDRMKEDMAGGAAVVCAMRAIGKLNLPVRVIGVVPTAENMPGGRAIKPGDVLRSADGKTVEVNNTDAEGR